MNFHVKEYLFSQILENKELWTRATVIHAFDLFLQDIFFVDIFIIPICK